MAIVETLGHTILTGLTFLLIITVLVFVHEAGHYLAARAFGMHVDAFAVMMGGVRKSDLRERLDQPMVPAGVLWGVGGVAAILAAVGSLLNLAIPFYVGMVFLTFVGPVWVINRLCALYHVPISTGISNLLKCWGGVAVLLFLGTRFQNLDAGYVLGLSLAGSSVAVLLTYYLPVMRKDEDTPQGHGVIEVKGEAVPVRFRPVWSVKDKRGTEFSLLLLPLGGFAAIKGMHPKADGSEVHVPEGFYSKPAWQRFLVLFAGPAFSLLLGVALLTPVWMFKGEPTEIAVVGTFVEQSPAKEAGLAVGDEITAIDGEPVEDWYGLISRVRFSYDEGANGGFVPKPLDVTFLRGGETQTVTVVPTVSDKPEPVINELGEKTGEMRHTAYLGVRPDFKFQPLPFDQAVVKSVEHPVLLTAQLFRVFTDAQVAKESVGGPGKTFEAAGEAVREGFWDVVFMAGSLSMVLGILNLLPFPPLDGGQMVIAAIETVRGNRRLNPSLQSALHTIGFFIVMFIMLAPFVIDANRRSEENQAKSAGLIENSTEPVTKTAE